MTNIPNEFTACEEYRGYIIAIRNGRYYLFMPSGEQLMADHFYGRAGARRMIDNVVEAMSPEPR